MTRPGGEGSAAGTTLGALAAGALVVAAFYAATQMSGRPAPEGVSAVTPVVTAPGAGAGPADTGAGAAVPSRAMDASSAKSRAAPSRPAGGPVAAPQNRPAATARTAPVAEQPASANSGAPGPQAEAEAATGHGPAGQPAAPTTDRKPAASAEADLAGPAASHAGPARPAPRSGAPPDTGPVQDRSDSSAAPDPADAPAPPSFDLVRVDAAGPAVVAGRAAPGSAVTLRLDGREVARVTADASGQFVAFPDLPSLAVAGVLSLDAADSLGTRRAREEVILLPGGQHQVAPAQASMVETPAVGADKSAALAESGAAAADHQDASHGARTPLAPQAPAQASGGIAEAAPPALARALRPAPSPVAVMLAGPDGVETLQPATPPSLPRPEAQTYVLIDTISYDPEGEVALEGRADPNAGEVRVYIDNSATLAAPVTPDGRWRAALRDVGPGTYTLRVDRLNEAGAVTARAESPFRRESRETLVAATPRSRAARVQAVTVQPGNTLWAIAREQYGDGFLYVRVFEANAGQIRDPDLIYPGQVFAIPE